ncbi:hypothetical protein SISNIDRAFT_452339 [Sistotremastrum niveocremeum HHB9708]|uniref:DUF202 domain-containing protein n=2 Tax=Sistotremastraceae TaxID=3402574 RepID=A0A164X6J8_9AGAM|nr:hypothetical protein SISNIDRAFT_452339 [Sistotremastrum niveocremeum HHB9708]KZT35668.1 hypothetical protein SISSUDRAFT_1051098 [Sistotremastrum suecicum HHB10207 ss-3]
MSASTNTLEPPRPAHLSRTNSTSSSRERRFRGHRANSFRPVDHAELVELRARQRTFEGAYARTAFGTLSYAILVLKLFDRRFYKIGLLYTILSAMLALLAFGRSRHSQHDFADEHRPDDSTGGRGRVFGRPFVTAGWVVVAVTFVVATVEIGLFVLVLNINTSQT